MQKSTWLPAIVAPLVVAGAIAAPAIASAAGTGASTTPPSAAKVLAKVASSRDVAFSGKVTQTSDLGLPDLSSASGGSASTAQSGASTVLELLTSSHTARVYVDGPDKARVQVLDSLAERDVIVNGTQVWTWDSKQQRAVHVTLPTRSAAEDTDTGTATPSDIAEQAIDAITPTTTVSTPVATTVAGQPAWKIVLTPKSATTLVHDVTLAIDQKTGLPLSAAIGAKGQSAPAVSVAYTSIDYGTPSAALFDFTPPTGATVRTKDLSDRAGKAGAGHATGASGNGTSATGSAPVTTGTGWGTIVSLPAGSVDASSLGAGSGSSTGSSTGDDDTALLEQMTTAVDGGRALQSSLVSVYLADDGRVFAGAVPVADLVAAAE